VRFAPIVSAAAFAAVGAAVQLGACTGIDQWSIDHLMPWASPDAQPSTLLSSVLPFTVHRPAAEIPAELWLYPASALVAAPITMACCIYLWRRGFRLPAIAWASALVFVSAIEILGKHVLRRPTPHMTWRGSIVQMPTFDDSFPSGHAARAVLLAALLAALWPRLRAPAAIWIAAVLPLLVVTNAHAPSDVVGAVFLGGALSLTCVRIRRNAANAKRLGVIEPT
jgi:membrane-associated phospholipid phosphatase